MPLLNRLLFFSKMNKDFRKALFQQVPEDKMWHMSAWAYLMGGEL